MEERSQIWIQRSKSSYKLFRDLDTFQNGKRCEGKKKVAHEFINSYSKFTFQFERVKDIEILNRNIK